MSGNRLVTFLSNNRKSGSNDPGLQVQAGSELGYNWTPIVGVATSELTYAYLGNTGGKWREGESVFLAHIS